jgi:multidrug efflux system membrane fusion protein
VYVVKPDSTVSVRKIALGPGDATNVSVTKGLSPGDQIVVDGADRLKEGAKILTRSATPPADAGSRAAPGQPGGGNRWQGQHRRRNQGGAGPDGAAAAPQP